MIYVFPNSIKNNIAFLCKHILHKYNYIQHYFQVFLKWREVALVIREQVFEDGADEEIDIYDIKVILL